MRREANRLQIPVDDPPGVEVLENQHNFGSIKLGDGFAEAAVPPDESEELSSRNVLHEEVEGVPVLEGGVELDDEGMHCRRQHVLLVLDVDFLLESNDFLLVQNLDAVVRLAAVVRAQFDSSESSRPLGNFDF